MKINIGVLGSCVSRDAFNSSFVHNYKDFFEVKISAQRTSMISIMQEAILIDRKLIEIHPINKKNNASTQFIYYDLNKNFLKDLVEKNIDYLIIDNYLEVRMGILYFDDVIITNNDWDLPKTEFYKNIHDKLILKITENSDEYFCIWSKYCDLFFKFLKIYCPNVKVILNKGRQIDKILRSDETTFINSSFTSKASLNNPFLEKLDSYIINNFDVDVIDFDYENTYLDENHIWGIGPVHYSKSYYYSLIDKVKRIIDENNYNQKIIQDNHISSNDVSLFKKELDKVNFETRLLLKNFKNNYPQDSLKFYNRGRIDIKNYGSKDNTIEVIASSMPFSKILFPKWFKSNDGQGLFIESEEGFIDLKFKCINEGILKIYLRGPDIRDKNNVRFPVYIDYINFTLNNELVLNESNLVWHNKPYIFKKEVKNSEIIDIHIEWLPFNDSSIYQI